jgi:hypothetical protein
MNPSRLRVQFLIIVMLMLNGLLLVLSRGEPWPLILLVILPIPLWYCVDHKRWYELPSWAANTIGLGIGGYAMYFFWFLATERHLAIVSDMVCYLLLTMLLQSKSPRLYWQITILSVLQSVVASVFSLDLQQGVIFVFYVLIVLMALSSIVYYRDQLVALQQMDRFNNSIEPAVAQRQQRKNSVILQPTRVEQTPVRFRAVFFAIATLAVCSVSAGMSIYVTIPRLEDSTNDSTIQLKTTGLSRKIDSLEPSGVLYPSSVEAFRVKIYDPVGGRTIRVNNDLYLRGACLEILKQEETGWLPWKTTTQPVEQITFPAFQGKVYRQEIVMVPRADPALIYALPVASAINTVRDTKFHLHTEMLVRESATGKISNTPFKYELGIYGIEQGIVPDTFPFWNYRTETDAPLNEDNPSRYLELTKFNDEKYPLLKAKAKEIAATVGNPLLKRREVCEKLVSYMASSGNFQYTTDFRGIVRQRDLDPVEDFLINYRQGHCELYASALCLMLRSLEIPARVVVGYRTAKFNDVAGHYIVQEKHAHSWVEAYLRPSDCNESMVARQLAGKNGGAWLRLDPTPGAITLDDDSDLFSQANDALGFAQSLWDEYIMGIEEKGSERERQSFAFGLVQALLDPTRLVQSIRDGLERMSVWERAGLGGLLLVGLLMAHRRVTTWRRNRKSVAFAGQRLGLWQRLLGTGFENLGGSQGPHWADELLQRLEKLAATGGFSPRKSSMTPLEFSIQWSKEILTVAHAGQARNETTDRSPNQSLSFIDLEAAQKLIEEISQLISDYYRVKYSEAAPLDRGREQAARDDKAFLSGWQVRLARLQKELPRRKRDRNHANAT